MADIEALDALWRLGQVQGLGESSKHLVHPLLL